MPVDPKDLRVGDIFKINPHVTAKIERFDGVDLFYSEAQEGAEGRSSPVRRSIRGFSEIALEKIDPATGKPEEGSDEGSQPSSPDQGPASDRAG